MIQDEAQNFFRKAFLSGRLAHAYIVVGAPRGAARAFVDYVGQLLMCQESSSPCGSCVACSQVQKNISPDMIWIEPERRSRIISIDQIRETVIPWASLSSYSGGWKIMSIGFADRFNENAANAFLKTLEEPSSKTLFLLLTDKPEELLPTIKSRCQRIDLACGREAPMEPWRTLTGEILAQHDPRGELGAFATASRFETLFSEVADKASEIFKAEQKDSDQTEGKDTRDARRRAKELELRMSVLLSIQDWYRDLLVLSGGAKSQTLYFEEFREELERRAATLTARRALNALKGVEQLETQLNERHMPTTTVFPYWLGRLP